MTRIAIVYHSGYGHTRKLADAVRTGAADVDGVDATLHPIGADGDLPPAAWADLDAADAIVFGSPTYMGSVSWQFKKFADASSKIWFTQGWKDKLFAGFTNSASMNGDKHSTIAYLTTLAMQHGGCWIGTGMLPANQKAARRDDVNYLGASAGLYSQSPSDASPDEAPGAGDLETGRRFGRRVAEAAVRFAAAGAPTAAEVA